MIRETLYTNRTPKQCSYRIRRLGLKAIIQLIRVTFCVILLLATVSIARIVPQAKSESKPAQLAGGRNDEFNGEALNSNWQWFYEEPSNWSLSASPGNLRIIGTSGDMAKDCNNPDNLLLQDIPTENFEIITKMALTPTSNFQQGGLVIFNSENGQPDLDNYVKVALVWSGSQKVIEILWEEEGKFPIRQWPFIPIQDDEPIYLKLRLESSVFTGYFSRDGQAWREFGSELVTTIADPFMGIFALSGVALGSSESPCEPDFVEISVDFDFFHFVERAEGSQE